MIRMHRIRGQVLSTREDLAHVKIQRSGSCSACTCSGFCSPLGKDWIVMEALNVPGATTGQDVIVAYERESELKASFILYIIPLFSLIAGAMAGAWLDPFGNQDISSVTVGFGTMILAFMLIKTYSRNRYSKHKGSSPVIEEIIPEN